MIIGANKYDGLVHTFYAEPLIKEDWNDLASDTSGTTPVTLGTDDWYPTAIPAQCVSKPFFNRLGDGSTADMTSFFYTHDRIYINDLIIYCNFADGLVKQSDITVTPADTYPKIAGSDLPNFELSSEMRIRISTYYQAADGTITGRGSLDFPVAHFNSINQLGFFLPSTTTQMLDTNVAQWFEIEILASGGDSSWPSFSTISVNPDFQASRCIVWAEATLSHTFATADADAVNAGTTGWPD